ncbi:hypothetical protein Pfo_020326 [Paulownia fortunei]|nr:hypothetical protein Pfo_020326 [Paulownia fortunei]
MVIFLQDSLELYPGRKDEETEELESKIAAAAYAAEDMIESHVVDRILAKSDGSGDKISTLFCQGIQRVIEEMDSIKKEMMRVKEMEGTIDQKLRKSMPSGLPRPAPMAKNTMVGFDDDLVRIMDGLTGQQTNLQIISIVGMGGIGKTTLAKNIYENPFIVQYFHIHAWITISQEYTVREILLGILHEIGVQTDHSKLKSDDQLGEQLHKRLSGMRYIIVMDDIWSTEAWDNIKMFFPNNSNGSRIMVTTRLSNVATHFRSCNPYQLHFLDEDKSWTLFCNKVFALQDCPPEMEAIGKKIVKNCRGLPLAIVTISGLLAKSNMTLEYWEYILPKI